MIEENSNHTNNNSNSLFEISSAYPQPVYALACRDTKTVPAVNHPRRMVVEAEEEERAEEQTLAL